MFCYFCGKISIGKTAEWIISILPLIVLQGVVYAMILFWKDTSDLGSLYPKKMLEMLKGIVIQDLGHSSGCQYIMLKLQYPIITIQQIS